MNQSLRPRAALAIAKGLRLEDGEDILLHRELAEDRWLLRQIADAKIPRTQVHRHARNVGIVHHDASGLRHDQSYDHVKAGCLPGAVRTEETDHLAARDLDVDPANDLPALV